jgi:UDP-N-acetyl-D-galactosamine dehydrogenase
LPEFPKVDAPLAVIGLGYVGLPLAVEFGKVRSVVGFDVNPTRIAELQRGWDRTRECDTAQLGSAKGLSFCADESALEHCEIFIVTVPTPIDGANRPDLRPLEGASRLVGRKLRPGGLVIFESTVFPGATEEVCVPILEAESGLPFNEGFFCGYSPERINPGDKVNTLTKIKKIVSGSTPAVAEVVDALYGSIIEAGTWVAGSLKVAEAAKVIENAQRDLNIAFVNELSVIFERLGIDTLEVLEAAGTKWNFLPFRPGMVGGHCIGVDPYYLTHKAEQVGYNPQVVLAGRRMNDNMARYAARNVIKRMVKRGFAPGQAMVGILGLTFKENCPDIRNSKVFDLLKEFESWGVRTLVADPWADPEEVQRETGWEVQAELPAASVDALVIAVGHDQYRALSPEACITYFKDQKPGILADLKALLPKARCEALGFDLFRL